MENNNHTLGLAIATVPVQQMDKNSLRNDAAALRSGTVFPELDKPFFLAEDTDSVTKPAETLEGREKLLQEICCVSFYLDDLTLYLDTHEEDAKACELYLTYAQKRKELLKEYAAQYAPLTRDCIPDSQANTLPFTWTKGPIPWEGACV